jgi:hypothetical protein
MYYSLEDILCESERLDCVLQVGCRGLGYLDESAGHDDLIPKQRLALPVWAALPLSQLGALQLQRPAFFREQFRLALAADATVVNLSERSPYFYELGLKLSGEWPDLGEVLGQSLRDRFQAILDKAQHIKAQGFHEFKGRLAEMERALFEAKVNSHKKRRLSQI